MVALYDLDMDRWDTLGLRGAVVALAADGERAFVLWKLDCGGLEVGQVRVTDDGPIIEPTGMSLEAEKHDGRGGLALVGQTLALLTGDGEGSVVLHAVDLDAVGGLGSWRQVTLDNVDLNGAAMTGKIPIGVVGRELVVPGPFGLYRIDIDQGVAVAETVTSAESCALSSGAAVAVSTGLIAVGGNCTMVDPDGQDSDLYGSYLFLPPGPADD